MIKTNSSTADLRLEIERLEQRRRDKSDEVENLSNIIMRIATKDVWK